MSAYFVRRLLLVPFTFLVITFLVYGILRVAPGGPIEQAKAAMRMQAMGGEAGGGGGGLTQGDLMLNEQAMEDLERYYALDEPIPIGYLQWLGALPRPTRTRVPASTLATHSRQFEPLKKLHEQEQKLQTELDELLAPKEYVTFAGELYQPLTEEEREALPQELKDQVEDLGAAGFGKRDRLLAALAPHGLTWAHDKLYRKVQDDPETTGPALERMAALRLAADLREQISRELGFEMAADGSIFQVRPRFAGILQGEFGRSYTHSEPVLGLILSRLEISLFFGLAGFFITWIVCIPLGVAKAVRHHSGFDSATSFLVLLAYSIPGYVVAMLLLASVAANGWLPLGGYRPENLEDLGWAQQIWARVEYMIIPVSAYVAGMFALQTLLVKNSVMENLSQDYVRTAFAKGLTRGRVLFVHVLRNSLIPVTAGIGRFVGLLLAGSFLIEKTCNIPGMGLLGLNALLQRDYPIVMGILVITVLITLFGNILSDLIWAVIDPRIRFGGRRS